MAASTLELLIQAKDDASKVLEAVGDAGSKAGDLIEKHWLKATAVLAGAGAGIEALARKQQGQKIALEQLAIRTGKSTEETNELARSLANVGFPLEDVTGLMELAARQGLESNDQIAAYANMWDLVADATGGSATELASAGVALKAMGIGATEQAQALDAFGFITKNTTQSVGDFLGFVEKSAPQLTEMGVSVNDAAALLGILEQHGISGRKAISEFTSAASTADGDMTKLLATLGVTAEEFAVMQGKVEGSGVVLEQLAGVVDANFTPLQKMQHELTELGARFAGPIQGAADFAPALIAIGPAVKGVQMAMGTLPKVIGLVNGAMLLLAANPIVLIIIGIVAAVAALGVGLWLLWRNWDTVWGFITGAFERAAGFISGLYNSAFGWILPFGPLVKAITFIAKHWDDIWGGIQDTFSRVVNGIIGIK
ncbi:MAG: phage tail tape measure protein, partial [Gemmatimonadaceae bacterium]|nr:phage tail tape measure protein [Gemmatimonadaceae bacterium]